MTTLKRLGAGVVLMLVFGVAALTYGQPCSQDPGQTSTPPCSVSQPTSDDSTTPGQTETPPASNSVDVVSISEVVYDMLMVF